MHALSFSWHNMTPRESQCVLTAENSTVYSTACMGSKRKKSNICVTGPMRMESTSEFLTNGSQRQKRAMLRRHHGVTSCVMICLIPNNHHNFVLPFLCVLPNYICRLNDCMFNMVVTIIKINTQKLIRTAWRLLSWASCQIRKIAVCACAGNAGNNFPRRRLQRKSLVSDPGMHHGTCVTHVPWCMPGSLTRGGGENFPGIPGACAPAILRIW